MCIFIKKVNCRNGKFFCIIKDKVTFKNKEIILSAVIIFAVLFSMPYKLRAIGVSPIRGLAPEIHRPAREHFQPYTRTVAERVDKVKFILPREKVELLMFLDPKNEELLKKLTKIRCGDNHNRLVDLLWLSLFLYAMTLYPDQAAGLLQQLGRFNAPGLVNNPPGYFNTQSCQSTVIQSQFDSEKSECEYHEQLQVDESYKSNSNLKKVTKNANKSKEAVKNLKDVKQKLSEGVNPMEIGYKPTNLGNDFYYIRKPAARIVVKVDPTTRNSDIVAFALRSNGKNMKTLATVVNAQCETKIKIEPKAY